MPGVAVFYRLSENNGKAKTNALDALRALIAERQQYEQWISALDAKREGTPEHVFERVQRRLRTPARPRGRGISGYAEELQLSISTLSSRLVEVAREEDTRREGLQEAELRAAVGEYEPRQWEQIKTEAEEALSKIAADRAVARLPAGELSAIQKLSEMGPGFSNEAAALAPPQHDVAVPPAEPSREPETRAPRSSACTSQSVAAEASAARSDTGRTASGSPRRREGLNRLQTPPSESDCRSSRLRRPIASAAEAAANAAAKPVDEDSIRAESQQYSREPRQSKPDAAKTLKCPDAEPRIIRPSGTASGAAESSRRCKRKTGALGARFDSICMEVLRLTSLRLSSPCGSCDAQRCSCESGPFGLRGREA